jgi:hypothetical protein
VFYFDVPVHLHDMSIMPIVTDTCDYCGAKLSPASAVSDDVLGMTYCNGGCATNYLRSHTEFRGACVHRVQCD